MVYKPANINLSKAQVLKAAQGKPIRLAHSQLGQGSNVILLHPTNYKLIEQSVRKGKGITLYLAPGELQATLDSNIQGTGFIDWLKDKAWPWLKKNVLPAVADAAVGPLSAFTGQPALVGAARTALKEATGIGAMPKKTKKPKGEGLYLNSPKGRGLYL
uniref:Uncharacterized protein n=1 Tax=viral metagenome TaxID=1070528 RepID=A0A6C0H184_9ZZZZ